MLDFRKRGYFIEKILQKIPTSFASKLSIVLCLCLITLSKAQNTSGLGNWYILNLKYNINDEWSVFGESQLRSLKFLKDHHYYEWKLGANYKVSKKVKLTLGAGKYHTFKEGGNFALPKNNEEFRLWPQLVLYQDLYGFKIEQRYRSEFRFTSNGYKNRYRYRVGVSYPFGNDINGYKPYQISASNEIFFTDKEPYFERNRMLVAFNYKHTKSSAFQIGYLHQFDYKINDETGRDFLQIGYFFEIFRKNKNSVNADSDLKDD